MLEVRKSYWYHRLLFCIAGLLCVTVTAKLGFGQQFGVPADMANNLHTFLQKITLEDEGKDARYSAAFVDSADPQKKEIVVYLSGSRICGTAGCTLLILKPQGSSFKIIGEVITIKLPIRLLRTESNGRRDIAGWSQWGGGNPGYEIALPFDGTKYPRTPSQLPAARVPEGTDGDVLIPRGAEGIPLFSGK